MRDRRSRVGKIRVVNNREEIDENQARSIIKLKGATHEVRMRSLSQKSNRTRFVYPRLTSVEHELSGKDYRRIDDFQESPRTKMGGEDAMRLLPIGIGKRK